MKEIHLKILPEYFDAVASGKKKYELRLGDKNIEEGDVLILEEYDHTGSDRKPTGRVLKKKVSNVSTFTTADLISFWKKEDIETHGIQIASLED